VKAVKRTSFLTKLAPQLLEAMCGLAVEKFPFHSLTLGMGFESYRLVTSTVRDNLGDPDGLNPICNL
jgi:hypothetical protein